MTKAQPIRPIGDPMPRQPSAPGERFDNDLAAPAESMFASM
jgi:hypothetical protein